MFDEYVDGGFHPDYIENYPCECMQACDCICHKKGPDGQPMAIHCFPCCGPGSSVHGLCKDNKETHG